MREIHGLSDAKKASVVRDDDELRVTVTDCDDFVSLYLQGAPNSALLTCEQAKYLAEKLFESATRVEGS